MTISPFTPLFFGGTSSDGIESRYMQTFAKMDVILIECICGAQEDAPQVILVRGGVATNVSTTAYAINDSVTLHYAELTGLDNGVYQVRIDGKTSREFIVTDDEAELAKTTLIQYSMKNNSLTTDGVFIVDGVRKFFSFRVPGGFKDSDISFGCESEQFTTQQGDLCTLYSVDSVQRKFTMGCQMGVPAWFGELLNRLLTCTFVYFDGMRYERKDGSAPEVGVQMEGLDSFVYKVQLQKVLHLCPTVAEGVSASADDEALVDGEWGGGSGNLGDDTLTMPAVWAALAAGSGELINKSHLPWGEIGDLVGSGNWIPSDRDGTNNGHRLDVGELKIGNGVLSWDSEVGAFKMSHPLYSLGEITAFGVTASGTGGNGGNGGEGGGSDYELTLDAIMAVLDGDSDGRIDSSYLPAAASGVSLDDVNELLRGYALKNHSHDAYLTKGVADGYYAGINHDHSGVYAALAHDHDSAYAAKTHSHSDYVTETWVSQQGFLTSYTETDPNVKFWAKTDNYIEIVDGKVHFKVPIYSDGEITAFGAESGGSGGNGGVAGVEMSEVWDALVANTSEQINLSHLTTALNAWKSQQTFGDAITYTGASATTYGGYLRKNGSNLVKIPNLADLGGAADDAVVHIAGAEMITGTKSFSADRLQITRIAQGGRKRLSFCDSFGDEFACVEGQISNDGYYGVSLGYVDGGVNSILWARKYDSNYGATGKQYIAGVRDALVIGNWALVATSYGLQVTHATSASTQANLYATGDVTAFGVSGAMEMSLAQTDKAQTWSAAQTFGQPITINGSNTSNRSSLGYATVGNLYFTPLTGSGFTSQPSLPSGCSVSSTRVQATIDNILDFRQVVAYLLWKTRNL